MNDGQFTVSEGSSLESRYRFFREHEVACVGGRSVGAMRLARAELAAKERGDVKVTWEFEDDTWDGEGECPLYLMCCIVKCGVEVATLGMIGLNSLRDPYMRVVEAELTAEVLEAQTIEGRAWATCMGGLAK